MLILIEIVYENLDQANGCVRIEKESTTIVDGAGCARHKKMLASKASMMNVNSGIS